MSDIIPPSPIDAPFGSYNWQDWYFKVRTAINNAQNISWSQINNFTGSNLTSLATRNHNDLQTIQGGSAGQFYHLTSAQNTAIAAGITATIVTAKLTLAGTNGSMTFTNGVLTASAPAT